MIEYSPTARRHVNELIEHYREHYRKKRRPEAIRNFRTALVQVETTINAGAARPRPFPATYRSLARPGRVWLKQGIYWLAYEQTDPPVIVAVFWQGADFASRFPENQ